LKNLKENGMKNNIETWKTTIADEFYSLDNNESYSLHPYIADIINSFNISKLLDFGCGNAYQSSLLRPGIEITLYDLNPNFINYVDFTKIHNNVITITNKNDLRKSYYDCVVQTSVLMCIKTEAEIREVFIDTYKVLKNKGKFIITLTHPCFLNYSFNHYYTSLNCNNFNYFKLGEEYEVNMKRDNNNLVFTDYHWTLSTVINNVINCGFNITKVIEHPDICKDGSINTINAIPWIILITEKK
jgi:hypothetical protein